MGTGFGNQGTFEAAFAHLNPRTALERPKQKFSC